jgi:hypothetical protein
VELGRACPWHVLGAWLAAHPCWCRLRRCERPPSQQPTCLGVDLLSEEPEIVRSENAPWIRMVPRGQDGFNCPRGRIAFLGHARSMARAGHHPQPCPAQPPLACRAVARLDRGVYRQQYTQCMVRILAVVLLLAVLTAACGGGSASSSPPKDHGGYSGKAASIYDAAYRGCYRQYQQSEQGTGTAAPAQFPHELLARLLNSVTPGYVQAFLAGCEAGTRAIAGPATVVPATTTP